MAIVAVAATGYMLMRGSATKASGISASTYPVTKRSFNVTLNEKGELEATRSVDVKCEVEGRSTIIWLIDEGAEVKKGDLLVKIASNEIEDKIRAEQITVQNAQAAAEAAQKELEIGLDQNASDIRKAQLALDNAVIEQQKYLEGDYQLQLLEKKLALETAIRTHAQAKSILDDSEELATKKYITPRELEDRRLDEYKTGVEVEKAQKALDVFENYDHKQNLQTKASDVEEARKELERTRKKSEAEEAKLRANASAKQAEYELTAERLKKFTDQRDKTEIRAPADGLVVYYSEQFWRGNNNQIAEGAEVYERQTLIQLPDTSAMKVKVRIHEAKTSKIAIGQRARIEVEGIPGVMFTGKVSKIAPLADSQNRWLNPNLKEYDTEITLDPTDRDLKPGVTARVEILVREVQDVIAVPIQAVYSRNGKSFAFVGHNVDRADPVEIETGYSSDEFVEVRSGLKEGDYVILAQDDVLLAKLPEQVEKINLEEFEAPGQGKAKPKTQQPAGGKRPEGAKPRGGGQGSGDQGSGGQGGGGGGRPHRSGGGKS
ncbi:MAG TPA: efflux RND transporter periplasmic adaptor subunit [Phycisphaerae bacterium]|nr:efflux RND transporter periplasmic adaptor subunit [Phycisphaerae bacterium]